MSKENKNPFAWNKTIQKLYGKGADIPVNAEELEKAIDRAENFHGTKLNETARARLDMLAKLCGRYHELSPYSKVIAPAAVNTERNAFVTLIQPLPAFLSNKEAKEILSALFDSSDSVMIANSDAGLALSFCVEGIWEE